MSMLDEAACGARAAGAAGPCCTLAGGIEKNHMARMPAPEITAVDFQSIAQKPRPF
jgi:hypothetical protein